MHRIQKISSYLLIVFNVLIITLPFSAVITWLFIETEFVKNIISNSFLFKQIQTPEGFVNLSQIKWTLTSKTIGFSASALGLLPIFLSLFSLKSIFQNYQKGKIFTITNAQHYRRLGIFFFLDALLATSIADMLMVLAATLSNPPGHRYISISFGTPNIEALFCGILVCGILVIVISWVMLEASKLHEEQQLTI